MTQDQPAAADGSAPASPNRLLRLTTLQNLQQEQEAQAQAQAQAQLEQQQQQHHEGADEQHVEVEVELVAAPSGTVSQLDDEYDSE